MTFPFNRTGTFDCTQVLALDLEPRNDSFQKEFLQRVRAKMEKYGLACTVEGNQLSFRRTKWFMFPSFRRDALHLSGLTNGYLSFDGNSLTLRYYLDLKKQFWGNILIVLIFFGPLFIFGVKGPLWGRIGFVLFAILFSGVASSYVSAGRFREFLNKASRETGFG
jgi:hypothetical protein